MREIEGVKKIPAVNRLLMISNINNSNDKGAVNELGDVKEMIASHYDSKFLY